jgi:hypothetical protein
LLKLGAEVARKAEDTIRLIAEESETMLIETILELETRFKQKLKEILYKMEVTNLDLLA